MKKIRVLIAKPGLDGHDRGALVISQALRDHGMEVIYTGLRQSPLQIVQAAIQEDVDVIGLSSLSGAHRTLFPKIVELLHEKDAGEIPVIGGGVIPSEDIPFLLEAGIQKVFTSGASTEALAQYIKELIHPDEQTLSPPTNIAHIGIAVRTIDETISFYTDSLGLSLEKVEEVVSEEVKVEFLKIGDTRIELLEPLSSSSPIASFIEKRGEGVHHIAFEVDDIEARLQKMEAEGIQLIDEQPKKGANNSHIAFIHPKSTNGVLVELCEETNEGEM